MKCPICNTENRDHAKFCDECGHPFILASDIPSPIDVAPEPVSGQGTEPGAAEGAAQPVAAVDATVVMGAIGSSDVVRDLPDEPQGFVSGQVFESAEGDAPMADEGAMDQVGGQQTADTGSPVDPDGADAVSATADFSEKDFSGFVFADSSHDAGADAESIHAFETAAIPLSSIWGTGNTQAMPRITDEVLAEGMSVSAPANKKEARQRERDLKKREKQARAALKRSDRASKGHNFILIVILVIAAIAILAAAVGYYMELWGGKTVPNTQGMTQADAVYTLQNDGFTVRVDEVLSDDTEGLVLLTDPGSGSRVAEGSEVVVHVSKSHSVPQVLGTSSDQALAALAAEGYTNIAELRYVKTNDVAEGTVLEISPAEGTKSKSTTQVTLTVATPYRVPDVTGMTENDAILTLREAGYYVYTSEVETADLPEGTIYTTQPAVNSTLDQGEIVTIYVAVQRSKKLVAAATSYLQSVGSVTLSDGLTYTIKSVDSVTYASNGVVNFTITGTPSMSIAGISLSGTATSKSGTMTYDDNNQLISIS